MRRFLIALGSLALVALAGVGFVRWRLSRADAALEASWRSALGGASFLERYPPTDDNATVLELERLGAGIGLEIAQPKAGHPRPTPDAAQRFVAVKDELNSYLEPSAAPEDGVYPPLSPALAVFVDQARPTLDAVVALLLAGPPPVWESDLTRGFEAPVPNYLGLLHLQRLLGVEALEQTRSGHPERALPVLDASWRLFEAVRASPTLIAQLISQVDLRVQQLALRSLPSAPPVWSKRMAAIELRPGIYVALQAEAFMAQRAAILGQPFGADETPPWEKGLLCWGLRDYARRFQPMIEELVRRDIRSLDPDDFDREMRDRIPRWQLIARLLLPNAWNTWVKAARTELSADLTARILAERARLAEGGSPLVAGRQPSRVRGLHWLYEETPAGTSIRIDAEMVYKVERTLPLHFLVRRQSSPGGGSLAPATPRTPS